MKARRTKKSALPQTTQPTERRTFTAKSAASAGGGTADIFNPPFYALTSRAYVWNEILERVELMISALVFLSVGVPAGRTFYVDARKGNDAFEGSATRPWRSLARASQGKFRGGDRLFLAGGQTFAGSLRLRKVKGVSVASFGKGSATIRAGVGDGIVVEEGEDIRVANLILVGAGRKANDGRGLSLIRTKRVRVDGLEASGFRTAGVEAVGSEDVTLSKVYAHDNGFAGIHVAGGYGQLPRSRRVTIRDSRAIGNAGDFKNLTNHSGSGILVGGVDECLIEYCEAANNGAEMPRKGNGPVGIWAWNADKVTIQHCISHDNQSPGTDGGGFDFDGGVTNSVLQYNLSFGNVGCGYLLCQYEGGGTWKNNVVRYNVSFEDGRKNFQAGIGIYDGGGKFSDAHIYNNTVVNPKFGVNASHAMPGLRFSNNVFIAEEDAATGEVEDAIFQRNLVWRTKQKTLDHLESHIKPGTQDLHESRHVNPRVILPRTAAELPRDPRKLATMRFFRLREGSPATGSGLPIPSAPGRDLFGQKVAPDAPSVGAAQ